MYGSHSLYNKLQAIKTQTKLYIILLSIINSAKIKLLLQGKKTTSFIKITTLFAPIKKVSLPEHFHLLYNYITRGY